MDAIPIIDPRMADAAAVLTAAAATLADAIEQDAAAERASSTARERLSAAKTAYNRALNDLVGCAEPRMRRSEQQLLRDGHIRRVDMASMPSAELHFDPPPPVSRPPVLMPSDIVSDRPALASRH